MPFTPIATTVSELFEDARFSFLTAEVTAGGTTLSLESIREFAINLILCIGEQGNEKTEIIKTHASTAPSGSTVTLASALVYNHPVGTKIYIIAFDQVEVSHAATVAGAKSVLTTKDIEPDMPETLYNDSTQSSGYYFVRYKNTITSTFTDYSDPIPVTGFERNTVAKIIEYAMNRNKMTEGFTDTVTHDFCVEELNAFITYVDGKLKRWSKLQSFNYVLGQTDRGINYFSLPSTMWSYSNRSVLGFRIGKGSDLRYMDKREWNDALEGTAHTLLNGAILTGATTLTLDSGYDFAEDGGTLQIAGQDITYTALNKTTGVVTGIPASGTGSVTANIADDTDVWQGASEGEPEIFTVFDDKIHFYPLVSSTYEDLNAKLDSWTECPEVDSDADTIDVNRYDAAKFWLTWAIRSQIKNDGQRSRDDGDYIQCMEIIRDAITMELRTHGQKFKRNTSVNRIKF